MNVRSNPFFFLLSLSHFLFSIIRVMLTFYIDKRVSWQQILTRNSFQIIYLEGWHKGTLSLNVGKSLHWFKKSKVSYKGHMCKFFLFLVLHVIRVILEWERLKWMFEKINLISRTPNLKVLCRLLSESPLKVENWGNLTFTFFSDIIRECCNCLTE
jgi:hypothetical protein